MKPETIEIKNNTNNTISVSSRNEEEQEPRGDFHDFDYEPDDISFLKPPEYSIIEAMANITDKERLDEEFQLAFEKWAYKNTSEVSVKIAFRAGYIAGRERDEKI